MEPISRTLSRSTSMGCGTRILMLSHLTAAEGMRKILLQLSYLHFQAILI